MMNFKKFVQPYSALSLDHFHDIIALRIKIFVIEQDCPYQDLDGKDKLAYHLFYTNNEGEVVAATRILPQNISYAEVSVGRVVVDESCRGTGLGHLIMEESMKFVQAEFGPVDVRLSAQKHLENSKLVQRPLYQFLKILLKMHYTLRTLKNLKCLMVFILLL